MQTCNKCVFSHINKSSLFKTINMYSIQYILYYQLFKTNLILGTALRFNKFRHIFATIQQGYSTIPTVNMVDETQTNDVFSIVILIQFLGGLTTLYNISIFHTYVLCNYVCHAPKGILSRAQPDGYRIQMCRGVRGSALILLGYNL